MFAQPEVALPLKSHAQLEPSLTDVISTMLELVISVQRDSTVQRLPQVLRSPSVHNTTTVHQEVEITPLVRSSNAQQELMLPTLDLTLWRTAFLAQLALTV